MRITALSRPRISSGWIVLGVAVVILLLASVLLLGTSAASQRAERATTVPTAPELRLDFSGQPQTRACSVSGDLVGDANPAEVTRALCGDR